MTTRKRHTPAQVVRKLGHTTGDHSNLPVNRPAPTYDFSPVRPRGHRRLDTRRLLLLRRLSSRPPGPIHLLDVAVPAWTRRRSPRGSHDVSGRTRTHPSTRDAVRRMESPTPSLVLGDGS